MTAQDTRIGELLVKEGLVTEAQISDALRRQDGLTTYIPLGQILVNRKIITQRQLDLVLSTWAKRLRLGETLIRSGVITQEQLEHALEHQKTAKAPLGQILIKLGFVDDLTMRQALAMQLDIPFLDLDRLTIDRALARLVNRAYARRHCLVPVASVGETLTVCMDDPTQHSVVEELSRSSGRVVTIVTASHDSIVRALDRMYVDFQGRAKTASAEGDLELIAEETTAQQRNKYAEGQSSRADVIVRQLLSTAIEQRASDVHIETLANRIQIRFRIDGVLEALDIPELQEASNQNGREIISRLKILGKLDIAERRRPQDGSFRVKVERQGEQRSVDLRISVVPGYYGESVVLRILDRQNAPTSINALQFPQVAADKLRQLLERPSGILLVTGPTGSGKSSTLYASLMTVYRPRIRVLTAEDPIEYIYDHFSQSEVNEAIGNTFASYLRAFLRHDPEVIMIGEIRDEETAEMAFRAAQTGHLLLSTLHTNSALGAVTRLLDLKIDPNTLASSLIGVIGQRLVRKLCMSCRAEYEPSPDLLREFFERRPQGFKFYKGKGCTECNLSGYRGRMTMVELWCPSAEDIVLIAKNASFEEIKNSDRASSTSMAENAWVRLSEGRTNLEELIRVVPYPVIYDFRQRKFGLTEETAGKQELVTA
jgi:type IV pilus assembly protein PilB